MPKGFRCDKCGEFFERVCVTVTFKYQDKLTDNPHYKKDLALCSNCSDHILNNCINKGVCK